MGMVKRDSIAITVLSYAGVVIGFVNKILLLPNFMAEEQLGLVNILPTVALMYAQFSALGINSAIVRFFPFFRTPDKRNNGLFFWSSLGISAGFLLFTALFLVFREPVVRYYSANAPLLSEHYLLLIPLALTTLFYNFYNSWLQALSRTVVSSGVYDLLLRLLTTAGISLFALGVVDFEQFLILYILIHFVPTLVLVIYTAAVGESHAKPVITPRTRRLLTLFGVYALWQFFGNASSYIIPVIDQTMLAGIKGLFDSGIYSIMIYMVSTLMIPYRSILKAATPLVSGFWKTRDMEKMRGIYRSSSLTSLIVGCGIFVLIWVNLDNIFSLMPESYSAGRYAFLFLGLGNIVNMYCGLNGIILVTSKKFRYDLAFSFVLVALTVVTNLIFIPLWGMTGAAFATMITLILHNAIRVAFVRRFYRMSPFSWRDLPVVALAAAAVLVASVIPGAGGLVADVVVRTAAAGAVFGLGVYFLRISPEINSVVDGVLAKLKR